MKKLTDILENKNVILDENSDASLEILLNEADAKPPENTDVGLVLSRLSDMISMSDDLYDTASSLEEIDKETADSVESTYNSLDELYAMFDDKYDIFRSDFDMGDIEMDEDFRISLDDLLNEATGELSEAFLRLPGHFINNELYGVERDLNTFIKGLQNGNDVNMKELNKIIKILQSAKKEVKKFNKPEDVPVSFQYKKESIEEAKRRNQGLTDLFHNLAEVERQLRPNSTIHRLVEKTAEGNYTAEFKKMQKLVAPLVKMWDDIEADLDTDYPRESIDINELTADEKKLIDKMYDKKGNLTPLGKKVMNHGKKPGDKGYIEEAKMSPEDTKLAQEIIKSEDEKVSVTYGQKLKVARQKLIKKYGKDWAKMVESINEAGKGDWVVVDLKTKKVTYVKSYDDASKYVKKNGGVIASAEYYVDNKKKFEDTSFEGEPLDEDKYTELGLNVKHTLNMAQTFWYKLGGKRLVDQKKYAKLEADYVKRGKVTVKLDDIGKVTFKNVTHNLTFKDKSRAMFHVSEKPGTPTTIGNFDALGINGKRGNMFHSAIKDRDLDLTFTEAKAFTKVNESINEARLDLWSRLSDSMLGAKVEYDGPARFSKVDPKKPIIGTIKKVSKSLLKIDWENVKAPFRGLNKIAHKNDYDFFPSDRYFSKEAEYVVSLKDRFRESIEEAVSGSTLSILKKVGFKEAPVDNATTKVVNSLSGKKLKLTQLFGISMRAGKWADIFVGSTEDGKYFVADPSGTTIFNKESELVTALKSAALGESINRFLKGGKDLNDIVG